MPHTPGPWKVIVLDGEIYINPARESGEYGLLAKTLTGHSCKESNAALIAAAPELLEAMKELVCSSAFTSQLFEKDKQSHKWWTLARHAIAKAEGRHA